MANPSSFPKITEKTQSWLTGKEGQPSAAQAGWIICFFPPQKPLVIQTPLFQTTYPTLNCRTGPSYQGEDSESTVVSILKSAVTSIWNIPLVSSQSFKSEPSRARIGGDNDPVPKCTISGIIPPPCLVGVTGPPQGVDTDPDRHGLGLNYILPHGLNLFNPYPPSVAVRKGSVFPFTEGPGLLSSRLAFRSGGPRTQALHNCAFLRG